MRMPMRVIILRTIYFWGEFFYWTVNLHKFSRDERICHPSAPTLFLLTIGAFGEDLFELRAISDFSAGSSEFSRRSLNDKNGDNKNSGDKKNKNKKAARRVRLF